MQLSFKHFTISSQLNIYPTLAYSSYQNSGQHLLCEDISIYPMALVQRPLFLTSLMTSILCVRTPYLITKGESVVVTITTGPSYEKETVLVWKIMSIWDRNLYQEKCKTDQNYFAQNPGWIFYYSKRNIRDQPLCNVTHLRFLKYPN